MKAVEKRIQTRHGRIRVSDTEGSGTPILFLHGWGTCRKVFERQCRPGLIEKTRIIALDLPGHGESDDAADPDSAYTMTGLVDAIDDVLAELDIDRFAVFGWSLGGHLAMEMLARNGSVSGVLAAGAPPVSPGLIGMLRGFHPSFDLLLAAKARWSGRDAARFERLCFGHSGTPELRGAISRADGSLRAIFLQSLMRGEGHDQRRTVQNAAVPVYLVNGADDPFIRLNYMEGFRSEGRDHYVDVIEGAGHAVFRERPEPFNAILDRFIDSVFDRELANSVRLAAAC
jgi:pimeloyl-ACP methyl ester carboxylesterase